MQRTRRRDTPPELALRSALFRLGARFFVDRSPLPGVVRGRADVLFPRARVAVYVDGCFWHSCPRHGTQPRVNADYWSYKLTANVLRDRATERVLNEHDWLVLRYWEHDDLAMAAARVHEIVLSRRATLALRAP